MSRITVAQLDAKFEALDGVVQTLKDELAKANRRILALEEQLAAKPAPKPRWRPSGTNFAKFAPDACKYFNKKSVSKQEIYDYINAMEAEASK